MGIAFMFQSALGLGPSKDNVCTATTPLSQAIVACLSKGPFGLGDEVNQTNATIVMAASRGDGYILQPTRTITPIDRTYSAAPLNNGQVWVADTHLAGFDRPWFNVLGWGMDEDLPLIPSDFYSEALYSDDASSKWDGKLGYHYFYDWYNPCIRDESSTACPGAFLAASGGSMAIPAHQKEEAFLQVAPLLGESYTILLGEVTKFVPFSPRRFQSLSSLPSGSWKLVGLPGIQSRIFVLGYASVNPMCSKYAVQLYNAMVQVFAGAPGELVTISCAQGESGQMHRLKGTVGSDGTGTITINPNELW
jgi:hypothetical protein